MFHFASYRFPVTMNSSRERPYGQVAPFGDPRIRACLRLSGAYRSLPRPSKPVGT
jgi:hypothetical protein